MSTYFYCRYLTTNMTSHLIIFTRPMTYNHENGTCSCGTFGDCSQPAAVYTESIMIPGIRVGCYPLNAALQSTLECLYNQSCVDLLRDIFNISTSFSAIDYILPSQFYPNLIVYSLANELLVENCISLRLLSPILINVFKRIVERVMTFRRNLIMPAN